MASKKRTLVMNEAQAGAVELVLHVIEHMLELEHQEVDEHRLGVELAENRATWQALESAPKHLRGILDRWAKATPESSYGRGAYARKGVSMEATTTTIEVTRDEAELLVSGLQNIAVSLRHDIGGDWTGHEEGLEAAEQRIQPDLDYLKRLAVKIDAEEAERLFP